MFSGRNKAVMSVHKLILILFLSALNCRIQKRFIIVSTGHTLTNITLALKINHLCLRRQIGGSVRIWGREIQPWDKYPFVGTLSHLMSVYVYIVMIEYIKWYWWRCWQFIVSLNVSTRPGVTPFGNVSRIGHIH